MNAFDTSVLVQLLLPALPHHDAARREFSAATRVPEHAALEAYSVLTRLPGAHRQDPKIAAAAIRANFEDKLLPGPRPGALTAWLERMAAAGVAGGATYDALVGETARIAGLQLVTFDRRARPTYERVGVEYRFVDTD